jgi:plasmid stabilization system protein ParE
MNKRFVVTPTAKGDLQGILLDLAEDSPDAAIQLQKKIYEGFLTLGRMPGIGSRRHYGQAAIGLDRCAPWPKRTDIEAKGLMNG